MKPYPLLIVHCCIVALLHFQMTPSAASDAGPSLTIRQNHLLFQFAHEEGRIVCAVQEIVVVENAGDAAYENPAGTVRLTIPAGADRVSPMPVPDIMPGAAPTPPLEPHEAEISAGEIVIKRRLQPGKNTFSYGYILRATDDSVRLEKKVLLPTRLLAAFAPPVDRLTSKSLQVEKAEEGFRILGHNLQPGSSIDLLFEGLHGGMSQSGMPDPSGRRGDAPAPSEAAPSVGKFLAPSLAGILLAVLVVLYVSQLKKSRAAAAGLRQFLMDEIESLDAAAEHKEISADYHKRKKKALMDRLREL